MVNFTHTETAGHGAARHRRPRSVVGLVPAIDEQIATVCGITGSIRWRDDKSVTACAVTDVAQFRALLCGSVSMRPYAHFGVTASDSHIAASLSREQRWCRRSSGVAAMRAASEVHTSHLQRYAARSDAHSADSESLRTWVAPAKYVLLHLAAVITGYSVKAMERKIERGDWIEGQVWRRAPDGHILIDVKGFERWVEKRT